MCDKRMRRTIREKYTRDERREVMLARNLTTSETLEYLANEEGKCNFSEKK